MKENDNVEQVSEENSASESSSDSSIPSAIDMLNQSAKSLESLMGGFFQQISDLERNEAERFSFLEGELYSAQMEEKRLNKEISDRLEIIQNYFSLMKEI
eukprot:TRINITY_DN3145_c0_g1_i1.p1 TRINITY_DN3145_c0_g1~~TRINITY_DN3145_c0_g1_i1.p1  ORF type:complete len:100 (-),score=54.01 TRINITY_DN3145_c0_g1_i1:78-377(-)